MFRLKESMEYAKEKGLLGKKKIELAKVLWPKSNARAAYVNLSNLEKGVSKNVCIANVPLMCKLLGVSADYLFGLSDMPNTEEKKNEIIKTANELVEKAKEL